MSFFGGLKKVGKVLLGIEHVAAPIVSVLLPASAPIFGMIDSWVSRLHSAVVTVEANLPMDGQGKLKSDAVIADFEAGLDVTNGFLANKGKMLDYDKDELQNAINSFVAGYNSLAKVKTSFREVDLPKP